MESQPQLSIDNFTRRLSTLELEIISRDAIIEQLRARISELEQQIPAAPPSEKKK